VIKAGFGFVLITTAGCVWRSLKEFPGIRCKH
jgi:hypothetical protein